MNILITGSMGNIGTSTLTALLGPLLPLVRFFRPVVRWVILRQSPYLRVR